MKNRYLFGFLIIFIFVNPNGSWGSSHPALEAQSFLAKFPSSYLPTLKERQGRVVLPYTDIPVQMALKTNLNSQKTYSGDQFEYEIRPIEPHWTTLEKSQNRLRSWSKQLTQKKPRRLFLEESSEFSHSSLRDFVIFARCVIRSFYIVRFEANDNPEDPIGHGMGPDRLCPERPQHYLAKATRFSELFFNL